MFYINRKPWDLHQSKHTPVDVYKNRKLHRREFLKMMGIAGTGAVSLSQLTGCEKATDEEIEQAGAVEPLPEKQKSIYPAEKNAAFEYDRPETAKRDAAEYTNFYEFSTSKQTWRFVDKFNPSPWTIEVGGLCAKPKTFDMDDIYKTFSLEERAYRHRCVETWAMAVPWTGFPLKELLKLVEPNSKAKFVALETFNKPEEAPGIQSDPHHPWPYTEGLTIEEATNDLALLATGIYGEPMPKQHGAPIRLVLPWKYGFKSVKSIVKITLTDKRPETFWNIINPREYGFEANVEPEVPHPRWSQKTEWMLGTRERFDTQKYNGYGEYVGNLYPV